MTLFRFKTFKSTFYFPAHTARNEFIYSLYGNYGGKMAHLLWWLFCHFAPLRWLWRVKGEEIDAMPILQSLLGEGAIFGVNLGTTGPDQKKSILGYQEATGERFFAKLSTSDRAKALSKNEIKVYQELAETGLVPKLYDYRISDDYVFLKCECINGEHVHGPVDRSEIMGILKVLRNRHYGQIPQTVNVCEKIEKSLENTVLKSCFAHMDFCPWNMIVADGKLRIIDWEMADERPLGFDLFTYLLQTHFLTENEKSGNELITENRNWIEEYFDGEDWKPYLKAFVDYKVEFFAKGQNPVLCCRFAEMQNDQSVFE